MNQPVDEPDERELISEEKAESVAERIEDDLGEDFAGYPVRVDAGEQGRVWVALEGAEADGDARRVTAERISDRLAELELAGREIAHRISAAPGEGNLVLVCELFADRSESV